MVIALTTGSGAILLYYFGLSRVPARVSALCEMCLPLSAILFDYLVNGSVLGPWQWVGAVLMLSAILRVTLEPRHNPVSPPEPVIGPDPSATVAGGPIGAGRASPAGRCRPRERWPAVPVAAAGGPVPGAADSRSSYKRGASAFGNGLSCNSFTTSTRVQSPNWISR